MFVRLFLCMSHIVLLPITEMALANFFFKFIYLLAALGLSCGMRDLVP